MKIAMLGHKRMPSREGGIEVVVDNLSTRFAKQGHDITLYSRKGHNVAGSEFDNPLFFRDEYEYHGVKIKQVPTLDFRGLAALTSSYSAIKAAIVDNPDIIHIHAEGPAAWIKIAKKAGIKTVVTIHGLDWQRAKWGTLGKRYIKNAERLAAQHADQIIVLSENMQRYFHETYNRNTVFIPNGIECRHPRKAEHIISKYHLTPDSYILYLGRIVPEKGLHYLIQAFNDLNLNHKLVIAGGPSDSKKYYSEIRMQAKANPNIKMIGFVENELLEELYSNCSLYVLPSDLEGMPMSLLEAMSYGCCCVTSDINECRTVLGNTGLVFDHGNIESLKKVLCSLVNNQNKRMQLGNCAKRRVSEQYNWDTTVNKTLSVYRDLITR